MRGLAAVSSICVLALSLGACGGGGERQDANEPSGTFNVEVVNADFPAKQAIAQKATLSLEVRNADQKVVPNVAVTIQTKPANTGAAPQAFAQTVADPTLADPSRPVWILDQGPQGGDSAYTNTWALGALQPGESRTFEWRVTAVKPGNYTVDYAVAPGLNGRAKAASGTGAGSFNVTIDDTPPDARIAEDGETVVREKPKSDDEG